MATFEYSETYSETNLRTGIKKEFRKAFRVEGDVEEVKTLAGHAFQLMPKHKYPVLESNEEILRRLLSS